MALGTVKWFDDNKGFGFVTPDGGGDDLFVHFSAITSNSFKVLKEGQRVSFDVTIGMKGEQASNVQDAGPIAVDTTDDLKGTITARGENGSGEGKERLFDNQRDTKWLDFSPQGSWVQYSYAAGIAGRLSSYTLTSAGDAPERDPSDWQLMGSSDGGATWTTVDSRTGVTFGERIQKQTFAVSGAPTYKAYRLNITKVANPSAANCVQLTAIELLGQQVAG